MTDALIGFLLARIAEDKLDASDVHELDCDLVRNGPVDPGFGWSCSCGRPARVLAECEAKRRIVELHRPIQHGGYVDCQTCREPYEGEAEAYPCETLRLLALPYADHPDYREEWKP